MTLSLKRERNPKTSTEVMIVIKQISRYNPSHTSAPVNRSFPKPAWSNKDTVSMAITTSTTHNIGIRPAMCIAVIGPVTIPASIKSTRLKRIR